MLHVIYLSPVFLAGALVASVVLVWRQRAPRVQDDVFRLVAQEASDGLLLTDQDSRIIWANPAHCRIMGCELEDLVGRYPLEFALPPVDRVS